MQIDYIRRDTPEEISENGGAYIQLVNKDTIGLKSSIAEAKSSLYVVGQDSMIEGYFVGLMRSVFEGIKEDGHPRTVGDVTIFPVCGGTFDLDKGWDPLVNDVRIKARLLNGLTLDITDWTFRDVTEGRVSFAIDTVSDGTTAGIVSKGADAELNGRNFPSKDLLTVSWVCGTKSGTVAADKLTVNVARITIDKSAFASLTSADSGQAIVFTVKGCYNKATKSAVFNCAPVVPEPIFGETTLSVAGGGSCVVSGDGGLQLKALHASSLEAFYARCALIGPDGNEVEMDFGGSVETDTGMQINVLDGAYTVGATYKYRVKIADDAGTLHAFDKEVIATT